MTEKLQIWEETDECLASVATTLVQTEILYLSSWLTVIHVLQNPIDCGECPVTIESGTHIEES